MVREDSKLFQALESVGSEILPKKEDKTAQVVSTAALRMVQHGEDPVSAVSAAANIVGVRVNPEEFLLYNIAEIQAQAISLVQERMRQVKLLLSAKLAEALGELGRSGAVQEAFGELLDALRSSDEKVRERAAKEIREIAAKFATVEREQQQQAKRITVHLEE